MTRKRNRANKKVKTETLSANADAAVDQDLCEPVTIGKEPLDGGHMDTLVDSGNESPVDLSDNWKEHLIAYHRAEAIRAWKFYMACILERYHWLLDRERRHITREYSDMISEACLHLSEERLIIKIDELQKGLSRELKGIDADESAADANFCENIRRLEAGETISDLPPVDPNVTFTQIEEFINKHLHVSCNMRDTTDKKDIRLSFTGSIGSEDSGCLVSDRTSPRRTNRQRLPSLSEIWKPEEDELLESSYTTSQFLGEEIQIPIEVDSLVLAESHEKDAEHGPPKTHRIEDDDSAIQVVIHSQGLLPNKSQQYEEATPQIIGLSALSQLTSEYKQSFVTDKDSKLLATHEPVAPETFPGSNVHINDVTEDGGGRTHEQPEQQDKSCQKKSKKKKKKPKTEVEVVEFVDSAKVKDDAAVKELTFLWSVENKDQGAAVIEKQQEMKEDMPQKVLSFASVAAMPAAKPAPQPAVSDYLEDLIGEKVMFSTKKPSRKFPETSSLNKTSICWTYEKLKKCPWGVDCIFAHGKKELRKLPTWFKKGEDKFESSTMKSGSYPHPEPCGDHYCHWRQHYLLKKTSICKLWQSGRCTLDIDKCQFAHGSSDLRPLPKEEICRRFMNGKCNRKSSECIYAHSKSEMRVKQKTKKPKLLNECGEPHASIGNKRLRTISETTDDSNDSWSRVLRSGRVRTISGTSLQSNDSLTDCDLEEFDWLAWNSQSEVPEGEEIDYDEWTYEECTICAGEFTDSSPRCLLKCGHDTFHQQCIEQWKEKDASCPICRMYVDE